MNFTTCQFGRSHYSTTLFGHPLSGSTVDIYTYFCCITRVKFLTISTVVWVRLHRWTAGDVAGAARCSILYIVRSKLSLYIFESEGEGLVLK